MIITTVIILMEFNLVKEIKIFVNPIMQKAAVTIFLSEPISVEEQNKTGKVIDREKNQGRDFNPNITCDIAGKSVVVHLDCVSKQVHTIVTDRPRNDGQGFLHLHTLEKS